MKVSKMSKNNWKEKIKPLIPIFSELGFILEDDQPHMKGERPFMQAVTTKSGQKFILLAHRKSDGEKVVIKATRDSAGAEEIKHERVCREAIQDIVFAYKIFFTPEEILFTKKGGYTISVQKYVDQKSTFLDRPLEEQFSLALKSFKSQESTHATTYRHRKSIIKTFGKVDADWYLESYKSFQKNIKEKLPEDKKVQELLERGGISLKENYEIIKQYSNFLTHTDFVPHNFRIIENDVYLLDASSLRFGNKYEGWARFLNFMTLYNRPLEDALLFYVKNNRTEEEYTSLKLMRIFRLGEIIWFYTNLLSKTSEDLKKLTTLRVGFWSDVLEATLENKQVSEEIVEEYKKTRDQLRSEDEKERQVGLH